LRLEHDDARKLRQRRLGTLPDPDRDIFRRRIFEPLDIVSNNNVEPVKQRFKTASIARKSATKPVTDRQALQAAIPPIEMPMQPAAAVLLNDIRQNMRRLERKACEILTTRPSWDANELVGCRLSRQWG